ncbi:MAG: adenylate/guanylate cyclase domain-containing protein [Limnobacter sp.]|nr:adenylate/guanylate cyclase domain-containing protein [Limnobacter sp.]
MLHHKPRAQACFRRSQVGSVQSTYLLTLVIGLVLGLMLTALSYNFSPLRVIENWLMDIRVSLLSSSAEPHPDVLILTINEDTLAGLQYRHPVDRAFLANVLKVLDQAKPKVIGLDVLLDQATEVEKDSALKLQMSSISTPLYVAFAGEADGLTPKQAAYLEAYVPLSKRASVNLARDAYDGIIRTTAGSFTELLFPAGNTPEVLNLSSSPDSSAYWDGAVKKFPAHQVEKLPASWLQDKIILIGAELSLTDRYPTSWTALLGPAMGSMPGVEIHAQSVINRINGKGYWRAPSWAQAMGITVLLLLALSLAYSEFSMWAKGLMFVGLAVAWLALAVEVMSTTSYVLQVFTPMMALVLGGALGGLSRGMQYRTEKQFIRQAMSHYVAPELVQALQKDPSLLRLGGERRRVAMIFTDISGFAGLSENMPAEELVSNLNEYLHGISELVAQHGGIVDKYIGDAVVALFNTPVEQKDFATQALLCALAVDEFAEQFRRDMTAKGWTWGVTRIGLHVDDVVVGNVGGRKRFDYTAMGDGMNTASRLEAVNAYMGTRLLVSQAVLDEARVPATYGLFEVANVLLKGKKHGVQCFTLLQETGAIYTQYQAAMQALKVGNQAGQLDKANALFLEIPPQASCASLCAFHIRRIQNESQRSDVDWSANVFEPGGKSLAEA